MRAANNKSSFFKCYNYQLCVITVDVKDYTVPDKFLYKYDQLLNYNADFNQVTREYKRINYDNC